MNTNTLKWMLVTWLPVAMLAWTSCSSRPQGEGASAMIESPEGVATVETYETTARVTDIDRETRRITLTAPDGKKTSFRAGPEVRNFDQIGVGDEVKAQVTESVAVSLRPPGAPPSATESTTVTVAPRGAKPGVLRTDTSEISARITAVDLERRTATLRFADGSSRKMKVSKEVDLRNLKPGDEVTARATESVAIQIEKP